MVRFGTKPAYQTSNGSSGRPSLASMTFAVFAISGAPSTSSSMATSAFSGISRSISMPRAMWVGAVGEYGSAAFTARKFERMRA